MKLAEDLNDFIKRYGPDLADAADSVLKPLIDPETDPLADLSALEQHRTLTSGKKFKFFPSQREKITGLAEGLRRYNRSWLIAEMACGKTCMALGSAWLRLKSKPRSRVIVMSPSHIVKKWQREIRWLIPNVLCRIVKKFADLQAFLKESENHPGISVMVISKESAKLGYEYDRPCAAHRTQYAPAFLFGKDDMQPGDIRFKERTDLTYWEMRDSKHPRYRVLRPVKMVSCPECGFKFSNRLDDYLESKNAIECACGARLATSARGFRKNPHIDRFIQRKLKKQFDLLIADEVHELAGSDTAQGNTFGTLASACKYTIAMTGTLIGGKAVDLHAPLWRVSPDLMARQGFDLKPLKGGKIGPVGRNAKSFSAAYGVLEHEVHKEIKSYTRGRSSRRKAYRSQERIRPGISPNLYNHFLCGRSIFMNLMELGPALPTIERELESCKPSEELVRNYNFIDDAIRSYIKDKKGGKGPHVLHGVRVQALDAYLDRPWGWDPITAPIYDKDGTKNGEEVVVQPPDMGADYYDDKDDKLVELCRKELDEGRRVCVYPLFTGIHDVRQKMRLKLEEAGLKAVCLPDSVQPANREDWIAKNLDGIEVLIVHPKRVQTGLDLIQFPTLIWYQLGYSTHVLRQASARARRPTQTLPCKVIFLYYESTIQQQALCLMGEKEAASQSLEGKFDTRGLKALMNGGESDDILAALTKGMKRDIDAKKAWQEVDQIENPFQKKTDTPAPVEDLPLLSIMGNSTKDHAPCGTSSKVVQHEPSLFSLVD